MEPNTTEEASCCPPRRTRSWLSWSSSGAMRSSTGMAPVYRQTGGEALLPYPTSLSSVIGRSRTRMPVA